MKVFGFAVLIALGIAPLASAQQPSKVFAVTGALLQDDRLRIVQSVDQSNGRVIARCAGASVGHFAIVTSHVCVANYWTERARYNVTHNSAASRNVAGGFADLARESPEAGWAILVTGGQDPYFGLQNLETAWSPTTTYTLVGLSRKVKTGQVLALQSGCHLLSHPSPNVFLSDCGGDFDNAGFLIFDQTLKLIGGAGRTFGREKFGKINAFKVWVDSASYYRTTSTLRQNQDERYQALRAGRFVPPIPISNGRVTGPPPRVSPPPTAPSVPTGRGGSPSGSGTFGGGTGVPPAAGGTPVAVGTAAQGAPVRSGTGFRPPEKTHHVDPVYPAEARANNVQGVVFLELVVGSDGSVESARVVRSIPELDAAALAAARQWKYTAPGEVVRATVAVQFTLPTAPLPSGISPVPGTSRGSGAPGASSATSAGGALPALGSCGLAPNYVRDVRLVRWRGSLASVEIPVFISIPARPGLSASLASIYEQGAFLGLSPWQYAIDRRENAPRIRLSTASSPSEALIQVQVVDQIPAGSKPTLLGHANNTTNAGIITRSTISLYRQNNTKRVEDKVTRGEEGADLELRVLLARVMAHEIGHALGILEHPTASGHMMTDHYEGFNPDVSNWVTDADVNTLSQAYCVPGVSPVRPTVPVADGNPLTPFTGRWTCNAGEVGIDFFTVRSSGLVSLAGGEDDVRAVVSGNSIRFEQASFNQFFYDKRLFNFSLTDGRLVGTRTETSRDRPPDVMRYTCRRQ